MKQVIFILLLVGLAYLGSVQVARFLYGRYRSTVRLYRDLQLFSGNGAREKSSLPSASLKGNCPKRRISF